MPTLFVKCGKCSEEIPTPIAVAAAEFKGKLMIFGLSHRCPKCETVGQYFTRHYFAHSESELSNNDAATAGQGRYKRGGGFDTALNSMSGAAPPP